MTSSVLTAAKARWTATSSAGRCPAALMMYNDKNYSTPAALAKQAQKHEFSSSRSRRSQEKHTTHVTRENHGIKEKNILGLLLPVGVLETDLDPVWMGTMSSFGASRGVVAHTSAKRVQTPPDHPR